MHASTGATCVKPTSKLDRFLYAPIREDANGVMITVLSAIARQELDPWEEAARCARLARSSAIQRVTELIATIPTARAVDESPVQAANRLVKLLPSERGPSRKSVSQDEQESKNVGFTVIGLMAMLIIQWFIFRDAASDLAENSTTVPSLSVSASP